MKQLIVYIVIFIFSLQSCIYNLESLTWWGRGLEIIEISQKISQSSGVIISDERLGRVLPICYRLKTDLDLKLAWYSKNKSSQKFLAVTKQRTYLYNPSPQLLQEFRQKFVTKSDDLKLIYESGNEKLWYF